MFISTVVDVFRSLGGDIHVTSPGGYQYPRALSWDVSAGELEDALEWTYDIREASVSYSEDSNSTRSYKVTFEVSIWRQLPPSLAYDYTRHRIEKQAYFMSYLVDGNPRIEMGYRRHGYFKWMCCARYAPLVAEVVSHLIPRPFDENCFPSCLSRAVSISRPHYSDNLWSLN